VFFDGFAAIDAFADPNTDPILLYIINMQTCNLLDHHRSAACYTFLHTHTP
jgi:hypothetical protein